MDFIQDCLYLKTYPQFWMLDVNMTIDLLQRQHVKLNQRYDSLRLLNVFVLTLSFLPIVPWLSSSALYNTNRRDTIRLHAMRLSVGQNKIIFRP